MTLSERDTDLLQTLTLRVRLLELSQIAHGWWPGSAWSEKNARQRLSKLVAGGFLRHQKIPVRPFLWLTKPAAVWVPGEPAPNFATLSWKLQSRWTLPPVPMSVYFATSRAAKRFGGFARGQIKNLCQVTHDLHVSAIFLKWHRDSPEFAARWVGEDVFAPERQGEKLPDAVLVDEARRPIHVIEFGGAYSRERLEEFHDDCFQRELSYEIWQECMMPDLPPRDQNILRHLLRYRVTTLDFLHRLFFADLQINAVNKIVIRLVRAGWLRQFRLTPKRKYFVLSAKAYQHLLGRRQRSGLSEQTLPIAFAIASFCVTRGVKRLTTNEFREHFPDLYHPGLNGSAYFIDTSVKPHRMGLILVDRDNPPRRLLSKVRRSIGQRYRIPGFMRLIHDRLFTITILTGFPEKRRELRNALQSHRGPVTVNVELVEELALLDPRSKS